MNVIGDVRGKDCIMIDDIVDSGGTLCNAADALLANGATSVTAYITHGVLSGGAVARITGFQAERNSSSPIFPSSPRRASRPPPTSVSCRSPISLAIRRSRARPRKNPCRACSTDASRLWVLSA